MITAVPSSLVTDNYRQEWFSVGYGTIKCRDRRTSCGDGEGGIDHD